VTPKVDSISSSKYTITIPVTSAGEYTISSSKLVNYNGSIGFVIRSGMPDAIKSQCTLGKSNSSPTFTDKTNIAFNCSLIDSNGNKVDIAWANNKFGMSVGCKMLRTSPSSTEKISDNINIDSNTFTCNFTASVIGDYKLEAFTSWDKTNITLSNHINTFTMLNNPPDISIGSYYDFSTSTWNTYSSTNQPKINVNNYYLT
jgi:hypothetical protein